MNCTILLAKVHGSQIMLLGKRIVSDQLTHHHQMSASHSTNGQMNNSSDENALSPTETRAILTPFAFKIDKSLFGIAIARPWRRAIALSIDLLLIAILSEAPGELLALLVAITLYRIGAKKSRSHPEKKRGIRKALLRITAAITIFIVLAEVLPEIFSGIDKAEQQQTTSEIANVVDKKTGVASFESDSSSLTGSAYKLASTMAISQSDCREIACWQVLLSGLFNGYEKQSPSDLEAEQFIRQLVTHVDNQGQLSSIEIQQLKDVLHQIHIARVAQIQPQEILQRVSSPDRDEVAQTNTSDAPANQSAEHTADKKQSNKLYQALAWIKSNIDSLGIGFGWAAFYFTMFTALWKGQTPGKKIMKIRVLQLDGTALSVWDSFGRYGGYGAGLATGLLGFAQVFWDPNRQAIHDKISATIVIDDSVTFKRDNRAKNKL